MAHARVAKAVELAIGLYDRRVETHRNPVRHLDCNTHLVARAAPALTTPVQVPRATHPQVRVQHKAVVPNDLKVLPVRLDTLDHATQTGPRAVQSRGVEARHCTTGQRRPQGSSGAMDRVAFRHEQRLRNRQTPVARYLRKLSSR